MGWLDLVVSSSCWLDQSLKARLQRFKTFQIKDAYIRDAVKIVGEFRNTLCDKLGKTKVMSMEDHVNSLPQLNANSMELFFTSKQFDSTQCCDRLFESMFDAICTVVAAYVWNWTLIEWIETVSTTEPEQVLSLQRVFTAEELYVLSEFKMHLNRFQKPLDEFLLHLTLNGFDGPSIVELQESSRAVRDYVETLAFGHLITILPQTVYLTSDHLLSAILGIKVTFVKYMQCCDQEIRNHEPNDYWVENFICEYMRGTDNWPGGSYDVGIAALEHMQFTNSRATILVKWLGSKQLHQQQTLEYWVRAWIEDMFKYNILLAEDVQQFPWGDITDQIICKSVLTDEGDEVAVGVLNSQENNFEPIVHSLVDCDSTDPGDQCTLFFHGTDHLSAVSLVVDGISPSHGSRKQDFSDSRGFYLYANFNAALQWAQMKSKKPAVIIYRVPSDLLSSFTGVHLVSADKAAKGCWDLWTFVVSKSRSGHSIKKCNVNNGSAWRSNSDFIVGPQCTEPSRIDDGDADASSKAGVQQTCILTDRLAQAFGDPHNIKLALFL